MFQGNGKIWQTVQVASRPVSGFVTSSPSSYSRAIWHPMPRTGRSASGRYNQTSAAELSTVGRGPPRKTVRIPGPGSHRLCSAGRLSTRGRQMWLQTATLLARVSRVVSCPELSLRHGRAASCASEHRLSQPRRENGTWGGHV